MLSQFRGTRQRRWTGADASYFGGSLQRGDHWQLRAVLVEIIHGVALQAADFYRLLVVAMQNAGAFAQNVYRTHAGTACAQNVRVQNSERRAAQVSSGDFFDETRNIDVGGAGSGTGRVEAIEAAIRFR